MKKDKSLRNLVEDFYKLKHKVECCLSDIQSGCEECFVDAPLDGGPYGRQNAEWVEIINEVSNLQEVTDEGSVTTNNITMIDLSAPNESLNLQHDKMTIWGGNSANNPTAIYKTDRIEYIKMPPSLGVPGGGVFKYPNTGLNYSEWYLPVRVNGEAADASGNITIETGGGSLPYTTYIARVETVEKTLQTSGTLEIGKTYYVNFINGLESYSGSLTVGKLYCIFEGELQGGDDFTNIGFVAENVPFRATGTTPTNWTNETYVHELDDFENVGFVYNFQTNLEGSGFFGFFTATGTTPTTWDYNSPVVDEELSKPNITILYNNTGHTITWNSNLVGEISSSVLIPGTFTILTGNEKLNSDNNVLGGFYRLSDNEIQGRGNMYNDSAFSIELKLF